MKNYRYCLDRKLPTKLFYCPQCGKKTLKRYVDTETNTYLPKEVGRCNRENNCSYHFTATAYFKEQGTNSKNPNKYVETNAHLSAPANVSFIEASLLQQTLKGYEQNNLVASLHSLFPKEKVADLVQAYQIGTSKFWAGASIFWQRDIHNRIRTGKIMLYNAQTGKRVKEPFNHFQWVHRLTNKDNFNLQQCLFGEHLLTTDKHRLVAIVESEKTALIASGYEPNCVWLACGGLSQLSPSRVAVLTGRNVVLYPDLGGYEKWKKQAEIIHNSIGIRISVSDILEKEATEEEREKGLDIADFLIRNQYKSPPISYTKREQILSKMIQSNPHILRLIEAFDLGNPQTLAPYRIE